jgi:hypothetical protein
MPREERTLRHLVPGGNRAAVDRLDDQATQLSATPAQPEAGTDDQDASLSRVESVVTLNFASWNQLEGWLRQVDRVRRAA